MEKLGKFLQKFKSLGLTEHRIKDSLIQIIKNKIDFSLSRKEIDVKNGKITVRVSGPIKTEIVLRRQEILTELKKEVEELKVNILEIN